jgi:hypothetical protein
MTYIKKSEETSGDVKTRLSEGIELIKDDKNRAMMDETIQSALMGMSRDLDLPPWVCGHFMTLLSTMESLNTIEVLDMEKGVFKLDPLLMFGLLVVVETGVTDFMNHSEEKNRRWARQKR